CGFLDYNRDGKLDLLLLSSGQDYRLERQTPGCRLFRNDGGGFTDVTAEAGLAVDGYMMGFSVGDYDNDGWTDLFLTSFGRNFLLRNRQGRFQDVTRAAGILQRPAQWGMGSAFTDVDRDGYLDLYVANYVVYDPSVPLCPAGSVMSGCTPNRYRTQRNELYLNRGNGTFTECAVARGADDPAGAGLGVLATDLDADGWPDLFVANDGTPNALLHNRKGRFASLGDSAGVAYGESGTMRAGMGTDSGDSNGDGRLDLVITNFFHEPNSLYRNSGFPLFQDHSYSSGIGTPSVNRLGFGIVFLDLDQDGKPDLYVGNGHVFDNVEKFSDTATFEQPDQVLLNLGAGRYTELPPESGALPATRSVSRGVAAGDFNNDGAPDLLINSLGRPVRLLENRPAAPRRWLGLTLRGRKSNRDAVGARVELSSPSGRQVREVRSGGSYLSQSDLRPLFGLGTGVEANQVKLEIRWPLGARQTVPVTALDRYLTVEEPSEGTSR
ncbi:MAG: CRTAC1 family protein, partial [Armatimonadetes bacterium]|nr:CRTAC1 family protein [Armatimonadota bacterium]